MLAGRFKIGEQLGAGGMGTVLRGVDVTTGGDVAIKVLKIDSDTARERFARESRCLSAIDHPNVVRYIAHGTSDENHPFLVMELLDGEDLAARLVHGPLEVADAVALCEGAVNALETLHALGLVHRDLKPENLFLRGGDVRNVCLLDLGIARELDAPGLTQTGAILGTPYYMAPEQACGHPVGTRTDWFGLGALLYQALTGTLPFRGASVVAVLTGVLFDEPPTVASLRPEVPPHLSDLVRDMLQKRADDRPKTADEIRARLRAPAPTLDAVPAPRPTFWSESRVITTLVVNFGVTPADKTLDLGYDDELVQQLRALGTDDMFVERLLDGTVAAVFSGSDAVDAAAAAARAALLVRPSRATARIGLATGRAEQTGSVLVGELAERAMELIGRGNAPIVIDDVTARLIETRFDVRRGPDAIAELGGFRRGLARTRDLLGLQTPCVGRDRDLLLLESLVLEAATDGVCRCALLSADAGVGKTRVLEELLQRIDALDGLPDLHVLTGSAESATAGAGFSTLGRVLRNSAGTSEHEPIAARRASFHAWVRSRIPAEAAAFHREVLAEIAGAPFEGQPSEPMQAALSDPMRLSDAVRIAWVNWLDAELARGPVVLLLDDLHWSDPASLNILDSCMKQLSNRPLAVIGATRPELIRDQPQLWADRDVLGLRLTALTDRASAALVRGVLGEDCPEERVRWAVDRCAGNAFYLEELIRTVARADGAVSETLPDSLLGVVEGRLQTVSAGNRAVARAASVLGEEFSRAALCCVLGSADVDRPLDELAAAEIVRATGPELYRFRHALVRDAVYATLTESDRMAAHSLAGDWSAREGSNDAAATANHFELAGRVDDARVWHALAAEAALRSADFDAALRHGERAIDLGASGAVLGSAHHSVASAHRWRGRNAEAADHGLRSVEFLEEGSAAWYNAMGDAFSACGRASRPDDLIRCAQRTLAAPYGADSVQERVICLARAVVPMSMNGIHAVEVVQAASELAAQSQLGPVARAQLHEALGQHAEYDGDLFRSVEELSMACDEWNRADARRDYAQCLATTATACGFVAEFDRGLELAMRAEALGRELSLPGTVAWATAAAGWVLFCAARLEEARERMGYALALYREQGNTTFARFLLSWLAQVEFIRGDLELAESYAQEALQLPDALANQPASIAARGTLARIELRRSDATRARTVLGPQPDSTLVMWDVIYNVADAEVLVAAGQREAARECLLRSLQRLEGVAARMASEDAVERLWRQPNNAAAKALYEALA